MGYKRKQTKLTNIARIYLHSIVSEKYYSSITHNPRLSSFIYSVEIAFQSLDAPLRQIINNDFFYQAYPGWWKLIYTRSNYQRLKLQAVNKFLEVFHEI